MPLPLDTEKPSRHRWYSDCASSWKYSLPNLSNTMESTERSTNASGRWYHYGPWVGGFLTGPTAFHSGYTAGEAARTAPTFMRSMTPTEAARYLTYWQNMEAPVQVGPGWTTRLVDVVPSSQPGGGVYTRIAYYDRFGRMVGRTDVGHHGRPDVHPVPHHHIYDPLYPPSQMPSGGIRIPGSDPPSSVWPGFHPLEQTPIFLQPRVPPYSPLFGGPFQPNLLFLRPSPSDRVLIYDRDF